MKLQIDTDLKTIKVEGTVKLSDLFEKVKQLLPDGEWKKFTLESNTTINHWSYPIIIEKKTYPDWPYYPWYGRGSVICGTVTADYKVNKNSTNYQLKSGVFNVEC